MDFGPVPTAEDIRASLAREPKPNRPMEYDLTEAEFWRHRHMPAGSVIVYNDPEVASGPAQAVAVLVMETVSLERGIWVTPKVLGADHEDAKKRAVAYFRSKKKRIHLCSMGSDMECLEEEHAALHLLKFKWYPPGDFEATWISSQSRKLVSEGKQMEVAEKQRQEGTGEGEPPGKKVRPGSRPSVEERLANLRRPSALRERRVHFAEDKERQSMPAERAVPGVSASDGIGYPADPSRSLVAVPKARISVKEEVIDLEEDSGQKDRLKDKKKKSKSLGRALALAARKQSREDVTVKKRRRSRSRSRTRKSKKRRRRSSSEGSSARSSSQSDSSDESLLPPLKRKSQKAPGAVFKMLEEHIAERLSHDADIGQGAEDSGNLDPHRPKFQTYYHLEDPTLHKGQVCQQEAKDIVGCIQRCRKSRICNMRHRCNIKHRY